MQIKKCLHCKEEFIDDTPDIKDNGCYFHDYCYEFYVEFYGKQTPEGMEYFIPDEEKRLKEHTGYKEE